VNAIGDEVERCASLHGDGGAGVMSEHKYRAMVNGVIAPPSLPAFVRPRAANRAKHVSAHNPRANTFEALAHHVVVQARRASFAAVHLLVAASAELPSKDSQASDAKRID
jgi:hypothetical protein